MSDTTEVLGSSSIYYDEGEIISHLVNVWQTADEALTTLKRRKSPAHMHIMFEEAAKLMREIAPKPKLGRIPVVNELTRNWTLAETVLKRLGQKISPYNMHLMVEEVGKIFRSARQQP